MPQTSIRSIADDVEGMPYIDVLTMDLAWDTCYPVVDPADMTVLGVVDGADGTPEGMALADVVAGRIVVHDWATEVFVMIDEASSIIGSDN